MAHKSMEKNVICNLQFGPQTQLVRGIQIRKFSLSFFILTVNESVLDSLTLSDNDICV